MLRNEHADRKILRQAEGGDESALAVVGPSGKDAGTCQAARGESPVGKGSSDKGPTGMSASASSLRFGYPPSVRGCYQEEVTGWSSSQDIPRM